MPVIDQLHDTAYGTLLSIMNNMPKLEAFTKSASIDSGDEAKLPDTAFADQENRRYPIHTPESAAISFAYYKTSGDRDHDVENSLKEALTVYEVPESIFEEVTVKQASTPEYLFPEYNALPINNKEQVKFAQEQFLAQSSRLDFASKVEAGATLVKKALALGVPLKPSLQKLGGLTISNTSVLAGWVAERAALSKDQTVKEAFDTLEANLKGLPSEIKDREGLLKIAELIATLDEKEQLTNRYDKGLMDPLETVFNTSKLASSMVDLGGKLVSLTKLAKLPMDFWQDLDPEVAKSIDTGGLVDSAKLAQIADTLPLDLKRAILPYV